MAKTSKNERKAAEVVKCPYCDHTGSARGLFSHVRLAHQGKNVNTRKEWLKNPYSIEKQVPKKRTKFQETIGTPNTEDIFIEILLKVANGLLAEYTGVKKIKASGQIGYIDKPNP